MGLLSLSETVVLVVCLRIGTAGCSGAFRARAKEAAVGANKPEEGVLVVEAGLLARAGVDEDGVLGRELDGVFARAGVTGGRFEALEDGRGRAAALEGGLETDALSDGADGADVDAGSAV